MQRKKLGTSLPTLSPEATAFLKAAEPTPLASAVEEVRPTLALAPAPVQERREAPLDKTPDEAPQRRNTKSDRIENAKEVSAVPEVLVADSFKLPQTLHRRLLRASSDRKLERLKPYTKQDIVATALDEWLAKRGYATP